MKEMKNISLIMLYQDMHNLKRALKLGHGQYGILEHKQTFTKKPESQPITSFNNNDRGDKTENKTAMKKAAIEALTKALL